VFIPVSDINLPKQQHLKLYNPGGLLSLSTGDSPRKPIGAGLGSLHEVTEEEMRRNPVTGTQGKRLLISTKSKQSPPNARSFSQSDPHPKGQPKRGSSKKNLNSILTGPPPGIQVSIAEVQEESVVQKKCEPTKEKEPTEADEKPSSSDKIGKSRTSKEDLKPSLSKKEEPSDEKTSSLSRKKTSKGDESGVVESTKPGSRSRNSKEEVDFAPEVRPLKSKNSKDDVVVIVSDAQASKPGRTRSSKEDIDPDSKPVLPRSRSGGKSESRDSTPVRSSRSGESGEQRAPLFRTRSAKEDSSSLKDRSGSDKLPRSKSFKGEPDNLSKSKPSKEDFSDKIVAALTRSKSKGETARGSVESRGSIEDRESLAPPIQQQTNSSSSTSPSDALAKKSSRPKFARDPANKSKVDLDQLEPLSNSPF